MRPINFVQFRQIISAKIFSFLKPSLVFERWFGFRRIVVQNFVGSERSM